MVAAADQLIPRLVAHDEQGRIPFDRLVKYPEMGGVEQGARLLQVRQVIKPILRTRPGRVRPGLAHLVDADNPPSFVCLVAHAELSVRCSLGNADVPTGQ